VLDEAQEQLEARIEQLDEMNRQLEYVSVRGDRDGSSRRALKHGHLKSQVEGWSREFARITEMTGVAFAQGKWDAVEKVVAIYREKEARNASLLKLVNQDLQSQAEQLAAELGELKRTEQEIRLSNANELVRAEDVAEERARAKQMAEQQTAQVESMKRSLGSVMPVVEALAIALELKLPDHVQQKGCTLTTLDVYLSFIEEAIHKLHARAQHIVSCESAPPTEDEDPSEKPAYLIRTDWLKKWAKPRKTASGTVVYKIKPKDAEEIMALEDESDASDE